MFVTMRTRYGCSSDGGQAPIRPLGSNTSASEMTRPQLSRSLVMGRNGGLRAVRLRHGDRFVTDVVNDCLSLNRHGTEETPDGPGGSIASKSVQLSFTLANAAAKFFTNVFPESCGGRHLTGVVRDECARSSTRSQRTHCDTFMELCCTTAAPPANLAFRTLDQLIFAPARRTLRHRDNTGDGHETHPSLSPSRRQRCSGARG